MKAVIVYESMYGNTRVIADAIGAGLRSAGDVDVVNVVPVSGAGLDLLDQAGLIVVGGPTHAHGMSRPSARRAAAEASRKTGSQLRLDPAADGPGVRDWCGAMGRRGMACAAFDTRRNGPAMLTGRASKGIDAMLRRRGLTAVARPERFLVTKASHLARARWNAPVSGARCWPHGSQRCAARPPPGGTGQASRIWPAGARLCLRRWAGHRLPRGQCPSRGSRRLLT